jgi:hypothetical protein
MIPRLEDLSLPQKIVLTIVVVVAAILLVGAVGFLSGRWEAEGQERDVPTLQSSIYDDHLNTLDREAIEDAYRNQITHLFQTWMKDEQGQPKRALTGHRQARKAFLESMAAIDRRR